MFSQHARTHDTQYEAGNEIPEAISMSKTFCVLRRMKTFASLYLIFFALCFLACDETKLQNDLLGETADTELLDSADGVSSTNQEVNIVCGPQEPLSEFLPMFRDTVDIVLEPPDDIIPDPETGLPFVALVVILRGTLFVWHDSPTLKGRFRKGSVAPIRELNVYGNLQEYNVKAKYFKVFRDDRLGAFRGRYFVFRYGRPRLPDVGIANQYRAPYFVAPVGHTQYAVIYEGKIYRDNYDGKRKSIYALKGTRWKTRRDGSMGYDTVYVSGSDFSAIDDAGKTYKDMGVYSFVSIRIMNSGLDTRQVQWKWYIWVLIGKVDIVSMEEDVRGNTRTLYCLMNFTADTSKRIGEINHPWHIKPLSERSTP